MSSLPIVAALVSTLEEIAGYRIVRSLGVAEGIAVNPRTGWLPSGQQQALRDTMAAAFMDMLAQAARQGAQAIVGLRYVTEQAQTEYIVIAYGTAVIVERSI